MPIAGSFDTDSEHGCAPIIGEKLHVLRRIFLGDFKNKRSTFLICRPFSGVLVRDRCTKLDRPRKNGVADRDDL